MQKWLKYFRTTIIVTTTTAFLLLLVADILTDNPPEDIIRFSKHKSEPSINFNYSTNESEPSVQFKSRSGGVKKQRVFDELLNELAIKYAKADLDLDSLRDTLKEKRVQINVDLIADTANSRAA